MKMNRNTRNPSRGGEGRKVNSASIVSKHEKTSEDSLPKDDDNSKVLRDSGDMQPFIRSIRIPKSLSCFGISFGQIWRSIDGHLPREKKKSLYASPDELQCLIKQVLSWDIRSISQRNQLHDPLIKTGNGEAQHSALDSNQNQDQEASDNENSQVCHPSGDVTYHLILEGMDVSYRIDFNGNVIVENVVVSSDIPNGNQNRSSFLMWRDELS